MTWDPTPLEQQQCVRKLNTYSAEVKHPIKHRVCRRGFGPFCSHSSADVRARGCVESAYSSGVLGMDGAAVDVRSLHIASPTTSLHAYRSTNLEVKVAASSFDTRAAEKSAWYCIRCIAVVISAFRGSLFTVGAGTAATRGAGTAATRGARVDRDDWSVDATIQGNDAVQSMLHTCNVTTASQPGIEVNR
jgi:hypothetical protein